MLGQVVGAGTVTKQREVTQVGVAVGLLAL